MLEVEAGLFPGTRVIVNESGQVSNTADNRGQDRVPSPPSSDMAERSDNPAFLTSSQPQMRRSSRSTVTINDNYEVPLQESGVTGPMISIGGRTEPIPPPSYSDAQQGLLAMAIARETPSLFDSSDHQENSVHFNTADQSKDIPGSIRCGEIGAGRSRPITARFRPLTARPIPWYPRPVGPIKKQDWRPGGSLSVHTTGSATLPKGFKPKEIPAEKANPSPKFIEVRQNFTSKLRQRINASPKTPPVSPPTAAEIMKENLNNSLIKPGGTILYICHL